MTFALPRINWLGSAPNNRGRPKSRRRRQGDGYDFRARKASRRRSWPRRKRSRCTASLGAFQLTLFGIGCIIGTGIFVLTAAGAQKAGPGLMLAFVIAGAVCVVAALCYAEIAAMIPVAGSAYTYTYAVMGEFARLDGRLGAGARICDRGQRRLGRLVGLFHRHDPAGILRAYTLPAWLSGRAARPRRRAGRADQPARPRHRPARHLAADDRHHRERAGQRGAGDDQDHRADRLHRPDPAEGRHRPISIPFLPAGLFGGFGSGVGAVGAAATIFFAYVGFDAVSTAAEETKNPQRNVPIGLIGSLGICTIFYILVAAGAVGTIGGQPIMGPNGIPFPAGSEELARQCALPQYAEMLVCSNEALAHVLRQIGFGTVGNALGIAAFLALPSVILILLFGQTRIFFVMSRDGLLPDGLSQGPSEVEDALCRHRAHRHRRRLRGGLPAGRPARRHRQCRHALRLPDGRDRGDDAAGGPSRTGERKFRVPALWLIGPLTIAGCLFLFFNLPTAAMLVLPIWYGGRLPRLFRLQPQQQPSRQGPHRGARARVMADDEPPIPGRTSRGPDGRRRPAVRRRA